MAEKSSKLSLVSQASLRTAADKRAGSFVYDQHDFPALRRLRHKTSREIVPYHEDQVLGMCAVHALNAAVGGCHFTEHQFRTAAELVVDESLAFATAVGKVSEDCLENHMLDSGWFSEQAVAGALQADGRWEFDQTPLRLQPHAYAELASTTVVGAVVQRPGHWFALRVQEGLVSVVDSLQSAPVCLGPVSPAEMDTKLAQFPSSFLIRVRGTVRTTPTVRNVETPPLALSESQAACACTFARQDSSSCLAGSSFHSGLIVCTHRRDGVVWWLRATPTNGTHLARRGVRTGGAG
jgi:hypothetical protein